MYTYLFNTKLNEEVQLDTNELMGIALSSLGDTFGGRADIIADVINRDKLFSTATEKITTLDQVSIAGFKYLSTTPFWLANFTLQTAGYYINEKDRVNAVRNSLVRVAIDYIFDGVSLTSSIANVLDPTIQALTNEMYAQIRAERLQAYKNGDYLALWRLNEMESDCLFVKTASKLIALPSQVIEWGQDCLIDYVFHSRETRNSNRRDYSTRYEYAREI